MLHRPGGNWDSTHKISDSIQVTTSRDVLAAMARGEGPRGRLHRARLRRLGAGPARAGNPRERLADAAGGRSGAVRPALRGALARGLAAARRGRRARSAPRRACLRRATRVVLAFDFGLKRIGIASGDTLTAPPRPAASSPVHRDGPGLGRRSTANCAHIAPDLLVVGAPYNDDGSPARIAAAADAFAASSRSATACRSSVSTSATPRPRPRACCANSAPAGSARRAVRKGDVDSAAAAIILESWLGRSRTERRQDRHDLTTAPRRQPAAPADARGAVPRRDSNRCSSARSTTCARLGEPAPRSDALAGVTVANMFTEPSTRTRVSFELAAKRLGADVVNLEVQLSSRVKGESMLDTVFTLESLHVDVFVLRDAEAGVPAAGGARTWRRTSACCRPAKRICRIRRRACSTR